MSAKNAILTTTAFEVSCPRCDAIQPNPASGGDSHLWHPWEVRNAQIAGLTCVECDLPFGVVGPESAETIRVLVVAPGAAPTLCAIQPTLTALQAVVGGLIRPTYIGDDLVMIYNEDGLALGLPPNRTVLHRAIVGTMFFGSHDNKEFRSLDDAQLERVYALLVRPTAERIP